MEKERLVSLVCAVQNGENDAMTELYDAFYNDIYYYILKTVNDSELASDLTQDAFIEIFQTIGSLKEPVAFVNWSKKIAYHRCTAYFRKKRDMLLDEDEEGQSVFDTIVEEREEFIPDEALDKEELKKTIHEMIDSLPEEQRTAIMMRYFDEMSVKEIADIQGVTEGTVKSRLNYGRKAIKGSVEEYEKKNGVKLRCAGVVPLLLWLFREYRIANGMSLVSDATKASAFNKKIVIDTGIKASKKVMSALTKKIVASVIVASVVITGVVVGVTKRPDETAQQNKEQSLPSIEENDENNAENNVYGTVFGNTLVLSANPIEEYNGNKPDIESLKFPNTTSRFEKEDKITKIVIMEKLEPTSISNWFAVFSMLECVEGMENINTTKITSLACVFASCENLKTVGGMSTWDVSNVTNMNGMFSECKSLEIIEGISTWDVSNVTNMNGMFARCENLKTIEDISTWDVGNVTSMNGMFFGCLKLEAIGDLRIWDVSNVTDMNSMFFTCQNLKNIGYLNDWNVSNVITMSNMFGACVNLNNIGDLSNWDVSGVTNTAGMFIGCRSLESVGDLSEWDIQNLTNMKDMFRNCEKLNELPAWYQ